MPEKTVFQFTEDEMSYRGMLSRVGIYVGDRWFAADSSETAREAYLLSYRRRLARYERRRLARSAASATHPPRKPRGRIPLDPESQIAHRMPLERRKCSRRSTISDCPTAADIRTAWHFRRASAENRIRLGGMLMDLECYVDNSLVTIMVHGVPKIVGRRGGLKAWIAENCPELLPRYKTLQRIKGDAVRLRQRLGVLDPVPVGALMGRGVSAESLADAPVHLQPHRGEAGRVRRRFAWEQSGVCFDADGRPYFRNENYSLARLDIGDPAVLDSLPGLRSIFLNAISLNSPEKCVIETYSADGVRGDVRRDITGGWNGFFGYVKEHPVFLLEAGEDLVRESVSEIVEGMRTAGLSERSLRLIAQGGHVGVGRRLLDWCETYGELYSMVIRLRRGW